MSVKKKNLSNLKNIEKDLRDRIKMRAEKERVEVDELMSAWFRRKVEELQNEKNEK